MTKEYYLTSRNKEIIGECIVFASNKVTFHLWKSLRTTQYGIFDEKFKKKYRPILKGK